MKQQLRILCPTQHLGFVPFKEKSFWTGAQTHPDYYCCDSGSNTVDPVPLGSDTSVSLYEWQKHDLELMLLASRKQGVPLIIGSSGDTGTNSRVDLFVDLVKRLALKHGLAPFKVVYFYSQVPKEVLLEKLERGVVIEGLDEYPALTVEELEQTERIVAVAGVHPFLKALEMGADVIIGGRSSGVAVFASPAIYAGFPESLAYHLGRVLENAALCAEPSSASETVIGTITDEDVRITPMHPQQRCTVESVADCILYNRAQPFHENLVGGMLDISECQYDQYDDNTTRVTGAAFIPSSGKIQVKLEGAGKIGERFIGIVGLKVPATIQQITTLLESVQHRVEEYYSGKEYQLLWNVYGDHEIFPDHDSRKDQTSHEICILLEGIAETEQMAEEITLLASRHITSTHACDKILWHTLPGPLRIQSVLPAPPVYKWTIQHTIVVDHPMELFELHEFMVE